MTLSGSSGLRPEVLLTAGAVTASLLTLAIFVARAIALAGYGWDWSPDEGLFLDQARRTFHDFASLYGKSFVPYPSVYGPVLPALLSPVAGPVEEALRAARALALAWTLAGVAAVYALARPKAPVALALSAAALSVAPLDLTFWSMLIRPDGLMQALWLLSAVALLPRALSRSADRLTGARLAIGTVLLLAAVLTKATALLLAAPLVLGWLLVDRASATRLVLAFGLGGLGLIALLQWATAGGFLWPNRAWGAHPWQPWLWRIVLVVFASRAWPLFALGLLTLAATRSRWRQALGDGSLLLVAGGLAALPLTGMYGAWWHYLLPLLPALAILIGRSWGSEVATSPRFPAAALGAALIASVALALATTRTFPLPSAQDQRTAAAFYDYVRSHTRQSGGPILAIRPELAYYVVGQPVEMEGSGYLPLAQARAPGTQLISERLGRGAYSLVVVMWPLAPADIEAVGRNYAAVGTCDLGYFFGPWQARLLARRDAWRPLAPPPGTRCRPPETVPVPH